MRAPGRPASRWRRTAAAVAAATMLTAVTACGAGSGIGEDAVPYLPVVSWYVGPDRLDAGALADACNDQAGGDYRIEVEQLPVDITERHALLVRRLLAEDSSMDLLSLDSGFTAEFAGAGFLTPLPEAEAAAFGEGVGPAALAAATYDDRLVVAPWFLDPQVLWYRGNTAERAGLDTSQPISWDDLVAGAQRLGVTIQIEDRDGSGLSEWVNALVAGSGGSIVSGGGRGATVGLDSDAGRSAASVVELYDQAGVGPGPADDALTRFAGPLGGFLLASTSAVSDPALAPIQTDMQATAYPAAGNTSVAPLAGVGLAVPAHAKDPDEAFAAITCLTSPTSLQQLMTGSQHSASRLSTFDDPAVASAFRSAAAARPAIDTGVTVPQTSYWALVMRALDDTWSPVAGVTQDQTPVVSQAAVQAAIRGELR